MSITNKTEFLKELSRSWTPYTMRYTLTPAIVGEENAKLARSYLAQFRDTSTLDLVLLFETFASNSKVSTELERLLVDAQARKAWAQELQAQIAQNSPWCMPNINVQRWFNQQVDRALSCGFPIDAVDLLARTIKDEMWPRMESEGTSWSELEFYHYGFLQLLEDLLTWKGTENFLSASGHTNTALEFRHIKQIIRDCWNYPHVGCDLYRYIVTSGIFAGATGDELETLLDEVITANPTAVAEYQGGKEKVLGSLVGQVLKRHKADAKVVNARLREKLKQ